MKKSAISDYNNINNSIYLRHNLYKKLKEKLIYKKNHY